MELLTAKILKALFEAKVNRSINESYATVKDRFIRDGADKEEVKSLLDLHKKLKDMRRLKDNEINIDVLVKGKTFEEFKTLMSRYSEKDTATKTDKFNELKNKIVTENDEWVVYKIDTAKEAYLFHGLTKWCIVSGTEESADSHFDYYVFYERSNFYFIVRKNPIDDKWDYIALQLQEDDKTYWDKDDKSHKTLPNELNVPKIDVKFDPPPKPLPSSWKLNSDGTYDVIDDTVFLSEFKQFISDDGKLTIKFNRVSVTFDCSGCGLTSLEGCPKKVGHHFNCCNNKLTSLKGCPKEVGHNFYCSNNKLTSLKDGPEKVKFSFYCDHNKLTSLEGAPEKVESNFDCSNNNLTSLKGTLKKVGGSFNCSYNKLTSLEGAPEKVRDGYNCSNNKLTSLEGMPEEVGERYNGSFDCSNNKLTSLKGGPEKVRGSFKCDYNKLTSLEGCPKEVRWNFYCRDNKGKQFTKSDVEKVCKVGDDIYV